MKSLSDTETQALGLIRSLQLDSGFPNPIDPNGELTRLIAFVCGYYNVPGIIDAPFQMQHGLNHTSIINTIILATNGFKDVTKYQAMDFFDVLFEAGGRFHMTPSVLFTMIEMAMQNDE
jgi:hypothetical protein